MPSRLVAIRPAAEADIPAILAITNDVIAQSTAIYRDDPLSLEEQAAWLAHRRGLGYPALVAVGAAGEVLGYASFNDFRAWPGFRHTVEHSVHVRGDARGQGIGPALLQALIPEAAAIGKHAMVGGIDAANAASIRMHERLGFRVEGCLREVGRKFDRWLDLVFMVRRLP